MINHKSRIVKITLTLLSLAVAVFIIAYLMPAKTNEATPEFRDEYIKACVEEVSGAKQAYCECTLDELLKIRTQDEIMKLDAQYAKDGKIPQDIVAVGQICIRKNK